MGIRFSRPFFISKSEESRYYTLTPWSSSCQPPANSKLVYLPTACVLIAKRPHFKFMKDALSGYAQCMGAERKAGGSREGGREREGICMSVLFN